MPDLDLVVMGQCFSNIQWEREVVGSKGDKYTVRFERVDPEEFGVQYDFTCSCPQYLYRHKKCKHIESVRVEHCGWMELLHGSKALQVNGEFFCPNCGGDVDFYREAV